MKNSFLVRRFFILLVVAVILWTVDSSLLLYRPTGFHIKVKDYLVLTSFRAGLPALPVMTLLSAILSPCLALFGNWIFLVDQRA